VRRATCDGATGAKGAHYRTRRTSRTLRTPQHRYRRPKVGFRRVKKFTDERVLIERFLHDAALDTSTAAVNQAHLSQAGRVRGAHVFVHHRADILR
jgi:ribosomal protein L15